MSADTAPCPRCGTQNPGVHTCSPQQHSVPDPDLEPTLGDLRDDLIWSSRNYAVNWDAASRRQMLAERQAILDHVATVRRQEREACAGIVEMLFPASRDIAEAIRSIGAQSTTEEPAHGR